ncbi:hypothetical protein Tco_0793832 [Tanacetum coccineum]
MLRVTVQRTSDLYVSTLKTLLKRISKLNINWHRSCPDVVAFSCLILILLLITFLLKLALHTRNKSRFITGACVRSPNNAQLQDKWDSCNAAVLSWQLGFVSQDLYKGQLFSKIAKDVWDELEETYNKQDGYFDSLVDLPACTCEGVHKLKKHAQLIRLMQSLMAFDDVFSSVRSIILTTDPILDVKSAFVTLSIDESHRNRNVTSKNVNFGPSAFAARCFEFVGYPLGFKRGNVTQNNVNNVSACDNKSDHSKSTSNTLTSD